MRRIRVVIDGAVQGVGFREATRRFAMTLGLGGWVRNRPDGRVEAVFEGGVSTVEKALAFVRKGPPLARVTQVEVSDEPATGDLSTFRILS